MEKNTCRVCLINSSEAYVSIFDNHGTNKMSTMLEHVTGIEVFIGSQWPNKICNVCWSDVVTAFNLKNRFIKTNKNLKMLLQENDPFHDLLNVKVEPQELEIADLAEIVKTEIIELDFENIIYEEEPVMKSNICLEEIDAIVIESECKKEIDDPLIRQIKQDKSGIIECVKCVEVFDHKDPKITFEMFRKHMIQHNRQKYMCLLCDPPFRFAQELHLKHHNYILHDIGENPLICQTCDFISDIEDKNYWNSYRAHIKKTHKKTFTCDVCSPTTEHISEDTLEQHFLDEHYIDETKICNVCQKTFDTEQKFKRHTKRCVKRPDKPLKIKIKKLRKVATKASCTLCTRRVYFDSEINRQYHMFIKHNIGENPHKCTICGKTFDLATQLKRHNDETGTCKPNELQVAKTYKCYICNEVFAMLVSKYQHINTYHSDKTYGDCHLCLRKRIPSACAFEQHVSEHFMEFALICNYCGRGFHQEGRLNNHIKHMHQTKYVYCDLCGAKNKSRHALRKHMQSIHLKLRNYKCNECSVDYTNSATLEQHQVKEHGAEPRYKCKKCTEGFTHRYEFKRHFLVCTPGIYPQEERRVNGPVFPTPSIKNGRTICSICQKDYVNQASWMSHYYAEHVQDRRVFKCKVCHKVSNKLGNHKKHMMIHSLDKPHVCDICNKAFGQKTVMQTHRRVHTGEKPYSCTFCSKAFSDPSTRSKHMKNMHKIVKALD